MSRNTWWQFVQNIRVKHPPFSRVCQKCRNFELWFISVGKMSYLSPSHMSLFLWSPFVLAIDRIFSIHFHFPCYVSRLGKNPNNQPPISSTQCFQRSRTKTFRFSFFLLPHIINIISLRLTYQPLINHFVPEVTL